MRASIQFVIFEDSFKLHSPKGSRNFERIFKHHFSCKSLFALAFMVRWKKLFWIDVL